MLFHINGAGEAKPCKAAIACPFGGIEAHHATAEQARVAYEHAMGKTIIVDENHAVATANYFAQAQAYDRLVTPAERQALTAYANQDYSAINDALWSGSTHPLVANIDRALAKTDGKTRSVYRKPYMGYTDADVRVIADSYRTGAVVTLRGYTSTTETLTALTPLLEPTPRVSPWSPVVESPARKNVVLSITTSNGVPVSAYSHMPQEREWLLPRGQSYRVASVEENVLETSTTIMGDQLPEPMRREITMVTLEAL